MLWCLVLGSTALSSVACANAPRGSASNGTEASGGAPSIGSPATPSTSTGGQAATGVGGNPDPSVVTSTALGGSGGATTSVGGAQVNVAAATSTTGSVGGRGPTPASDTASFPFPQNRESPHCVYPEVYSNDDVRALYQAWKNDLVTSDGAGGYRRVARVAEHVLKPNSTVSEGIAYGMLISVYMDDQPLFDDLWRYAMQYSWHGNEPTLLMNWYVHEDGNVSPGGDGDPAGGGAATDADEDIAFALVMADRQWGGAGALDRSYIEYARELIEDIWIYETMDEQLIKDGSGWGSYSSLNISYFAPAYYRVFAEVTGNDRWVDNVVGFGYEMIDNSLNDSNGNVDNGLVPGWSNSDGGPAEGGQPFHYQYDSCRTPFRIGQDACWHGDERAKAYLAKTSAFFSSFGAAGIVDGYELDGSPRPEFPDDFSGLSGAFIGPAAVGAMHDAAFSAFVADAYALLRQNQAWAGGQYYDESWIMMAALMMSGNFLDYTQHD